MYQISDLAEHDAVWEAMSDAELMEQCHFGLD